MKSAEIIKKLGSKQVIISAVVIFIIIILAVLLIKFVPKLLKRSQEEKEKDAYRSSIDPQKVTLTPADFVSMANALDAAFNYVFGTDEEVIYSVFERLNTKDDLFSLMDAFGRKRSDVYTRVLAPIGATWEEADLTRWINDELDSSEKAKVNQILASKGIAFKF